ncbi:MAG TPA: glucose-1-phosphate cytidylyltransferase [Chloroflexi bacterium]|nr:glucose-1-phosphate cytidylyltransferase [Chloroflexota bacterium]
MPVVIVCGGQGTRMSGATPTKKELVEVGERPILWHVMKIYATFGHTRFILALGHQAEEIKRYFLEYEPMRYDLTVNLGRSSAPSYHPGYQASVEEQWEVTLADTGLETQKGSRIYRVARYIDTDTFFFTYGDGVGDVDITALLAFHRRHRRLVTITGVHPWSQYGILQLGEDHQVSGFVQKPRLDHWINAGFMVFERRVMDYLSDGDDIHLEREVLPQLASEGQVMMYPHEGFWRSMDTFKEALALDEIWRASAPWKVW